MGYPAIFLTRSVSRYRRTVQTDTDAIRTRTAYTQLNYLYRFDVSDNGKFIDIFLDLV